MRKYRETTEQGISGLDVASSNVTGSDPGYTNIASVIEVVGIIIALSCVAGLLMGCDLGRSD